MKSPYISIYNDRLYIFNSCQLMKSPYISIYNDRLYLVPKID